MYLTQDATIDAGRLLACREEAFVMLKARSLSNRYSMMDGKNFQFDFSSFLMIQKTGYMLPLPPPACDTNLPAKPKFFGDADSADEHEDHHRAGRLQLRDRQLVYLLARDQGPRPAIRPPVCEARRRFQVDQVDQTAAAALDWFITTPYDNLAPTSQGDDRAFMTFSFDLIVPAAKRPGPTYPTRPGRRGQPYRSTSAPLPEAHGLGASVRRLRRRERRGGAERP